MPTGFRGLTRVGQMAGRNVYLEFVMNAAHTQLFSTLHLRGLGVAYLNMIPDV